MQMTFVRDLPAPPAAVWPYVTEPRRMNEWSEAHVELVSAGADGRPDAVGAARRVTPVVFGLRFPLNEVVEESIPPSRFVYRVLSGGGLSEHRGVMSLESIPGGTRLTWQVTYRARLPGMDLLMRWFVGGSIARSLTVLQQVTQQIVPDLSPE
jgi:uncharacterized protein YndB with AHSA1/START domain